MQFFKKFDFRFYIVLLFTFLLTFWNLGQRELKEWDESRNGVNAYEMLHNHDYINTYYCGQPDTWNAKPPLLIWCIAISYKLFGFTEFALRFPTAISVILFFIFAFKHIKLLDTPNSAFISCLILLSCKAILGDHIGLTGDYDMFLVFLLTASVYYFILYLEFKQKSAIYFVAIFTGLAFYIKGTESIVLLPGFLIYSIARGKFLILFKDYRTWISIGIVIAFVSSWILLIYFYGIRSDQSYYGSKNSIETMLIHDTYRRLTSQGFEKVYTPDRLFIFSAIDVRLNIWNYFFYLSIGLGLYYLSTSKKSLMNICNSDTFRMSLLSISLIVPLSLILAFSVNSHDWYFAPIFLFFAYIITRGLFYLSSLWKPFNCVMIGILIFTLSRHFNYIRNLDCETHNVFKNSKQMYFNGKAIYAFENPKQNIQLYFDWQNKNINILKNIDEMKNHINDLFLIKKTNFETMNNLNLKTVLSFDEYYLVKLIK